MAKNLLKAGHKLIVFDVVRATVDDVVASGAARGESSSHVASKSEIVITMLPDGPDVEAAMLGSAGVLEGARKGCIVVDDASGEEFFQPAATVVLASFTLRNTRLLALSKIGTQYDPVTRKGTLGRNLNPPGGSEYARLFR
jgi:2-hydroxy-3-oxopropionate reductase